MLIPVFVAWETKPLAKGCHLLVRWCVLAGAMLVISNTAARVDTRRIAAQEDALALKFNEFYCNTRTLQICMEDQDLAVLT